jgi:hypothetical protein
MKKWTLLSVVILTFTLVQALSFPTRNAAAQAKPEDSSKNQVTADILIPPGIPLGIDEATVSFADGRALSELTFIVTNKSAVSIQKVKLVAIVVDKQDNIKGAESWIEEFDLRPDSRIKKKAILKNAAWAGYRVILILEYARASNELWHTLLNEEFDTAKAYVRTGQNTFKEAQYKNSKVRPLDYIPEFGGEPGDVCSQRLTQAIAACRNGLGSFSCDPNTGVFSFTCS